MVGLNIMTFVMAHSPVPTPIRIPQVETKDPYFSCTRLFASVIHPSYIDAREQPCLSGNTTRSSVCRTTERSKVYSREPVAFFSFDSTLKPSGGSLDSLHILSDSNLEAGWATYDWQQDCHRENLVYNAPVDLTYLTYPCSFRFPPSRTCPRQMDTIGAPARSILSWRPMTTTAMRIMLPA